MVDTLTILFPASWAFFLIYLLWYLTAAKCNTSITFDDAKALWQIHKKTTQCASRKWRPLSRKSGKISGFECECGFTYTQKRPILSSKPRSNHVNHGNQAPFSVASY